jgi:solute carrier family 25 S-adenosylmethionine transporter 26
MKVCHFILRMRFALVLACLLASLAVAQSISRSPLALHNSAIRATILKDRLRALRDDVINAVPESSKNSVAGALAAAVVKLTLQPFDTLKTMQQMDKNGAGLLATTADFVRQRGILGLWSGVGITIMGSVPSVALYFGIFNAVKARLTAAFPLQYRSVAIALAAITGNTAASVLRAPYEVLKTRMQLARHPSLYSALLYSIREEGVLGLFGGGKLISQILRDVPYAVITGVCYEALQGVANKRKRKEEPPVVPRTSNDEKRAKITQDATCGGIAGGISTLLTTPMDVVKTRLMSGGGEFKYASVGDAVMRMAREEGPGAFFIGTPSRLLHKIPANGLFYLFYEAFRTILGVKENYV